MKYKIQETRGASLLFALLTLTVVLVIVFGVATLMVGEIKISREVPYSLRAYYAAEVGIERKLYEARQNGNNSDILPRCSVFLDDGSSYGVDFKKTGGSTTIKSWGCYKNVKRAIEIIY